MDLLGHLQDCILFAGSAFLSVSHVGVGTRTGLGLQSLGLGCHDLVLYEVLKTLNLATQIKM